MSDIAVWLALFAGIALGALASLLWRARREQALRIEMEVLRTRVQTEETMRVEREQAAARAQDQLRGAFGELARESLQSNSEVFLQLARERLGRQQLDASQALKERESAIESLVQPIREALAKTEAQIQAIERDRIDSFATMKTEMDGLATGQNALSRETRNLVTALRRPGVRGQWGEITLRRVVELSGMSLHVDFSEQQHVVTESGAIRPDMIVLERSPDFVVLFLPGDQFLSAALQENPGLVDEAMRQNIMLATPTSLIALLKVISYGWKQTVLAENAKEVRQLGEELYKRLAVFGEHLGKLGKSLGSSVDSFNRAVGSLEQQVLPSARRFESLGLRVTREIEPIEPVESLTRTPRVEAAERAASDEPDSQDT